jgi:hypothetical protein
VQVVSHTSTTVDETKTLNFGWGCCARPRHPPLHHDHQYHHRRQHCRHHAIVIFPFIMIIRIIITHAIGILPSSVSSPSSSAPASCHRHPALNIAIIIIIIIVMIHHHSYHHRRVNDIFLLIIVIMFIIDVSINITITIVVIIIIIIIIMHQS